MSNKQNFENLINLFAKRTENWPFLCKFHSQLAAAARRRRFRPRRHLFYCLASHFGPLLHRKSSVCYFVVSVILPSASEGDEASKFRKNFQEIKSEEDSFKKNRPLYAKIAKLPRRSKSKFQAFYDSAPDTNFNRPPRRNGRPKPPSAGTKVD